MFTQPWEKERLSDHNQFCTHVEVASVMTIAHFGVDISRDMGYGGSKNVGVFLYFVVGPYNCSTNVLL